MSKPRDVQGPGRCFGGGALSELRVFETPAGPACEACVVEHYEVEIVETSGPIGYDAAGPDEDDVYSMERGDFTGDYCTYCRLTMPADGEPGGRALTWPEGGRAVDRVDELLATNATVLDALARRKGVGS